MSISFQVEGINIGSGNLFLIAGPCVIESESHASEIAGCLAAIARAVGVPFIFKASYDKANRTSLKSFRGPGLREGLQRFEPGAQGEHKLARGFLPAKTESFHWIADRRFRAAIDDALVRERRGLLAYGEDLMEHSPYVRRDCDDASQLSP